jgi:RHS repeat-associated protein
MRLIFIFLLASTYLAAQYDAAIKSYVPVSPNAAAFAKVAEIPVSTFNGTASIDIPLFQASDNQLQHNISLSYSTSGIKANEVASSVGLGWNLNAGGAITRSLRGAPDEGLFLEQYNGFYTDGVDETWFNNEFDFTDIINGRRDVQSDIYYYNFDGISGSFTFDRNKNIVEKIKSDLKIIPIVTNYATNKFLWKIITPDGTTYYFGDTTLDGVVDDAVSYSNQYSHDKNQQGAINRLTPLVDSWYLVKKESWDQTSKIDFIYDKFEAYSFYNYSSGGKLVVDNIARNAYPINDASAANVVLNSENLSPKITSIVTNNRLYAFEYEGLKRADLDVYETPGSHPRFVVGVPSNKITNPEALTRIIEKSTSGVFLNSFDLKQSYFESPPFGFDGSLGVITTPLSIKSDMRRLRLDSIVRNSVDGKHFVHKMEYNDNIIQRRLSFGVDHHGFPNGENDNHTLIPNLKIDTSAFAMPLVDLTSFANRSPNYSVSMKPMLKSLTLPTGGKQSFVYEGHSFNTNDVVETRVNVADIRNSNCSSPVPSLSCSTCCVGETITTSPVTITNTPLKRYEIIVTIQKVIGDNTTSPIYPEFFMKPGTLPFQITDNYTLNAANNFKVVICYSQESLPFSNTGQYQFRLTADPTRRVFMNIIVREYTRQNINRNEEIGGLRIKSITDDPIDGAPITRSFEYTEPSSTNSSGYLVSLPEYLEAFPPNTQIRIGTINSGGVFGLGNADQCLGIKYYLSSGSTFPLSSIQGSHIGYKRVVERLDNGNGYKVFVYNTDPSVKARYFRSIFSPFQYIDPVAGTLASSIVYDANNTIIENIDNTYTKFNYPQSTQEISAHQAPSCGVGASSLAIKKYTTIYSDFVFLSKSDKTMDGVSTSFYNEHGLLAQGFTFKTADYFTNSDNKVHRNEYSYNMFYPFDDSIKVGLLRKQRLLPPYETLLKVNGITVDGSRSIYKFTTSAGLVINDGTPNSSLTSKTYPSIIQRRETTFNPSESIIDNGWQPQMVIQKYDLSVGKPTEIKADGWQPIQFLEWNTIGKLLSYNYGSFTSSYGYDATTHELINKTNIDLTSEAYVYDALFRLKSMTLLPKNVVNNYEYAYKSIGLENNFMKNILKFPLVPNSSMDSVVLYAYADGLGRPTQSVDKYGAPNGSDVVKNRMEYNNLGRAIKGYTPQQVTNNHGNYVPTIGSTPFAFNTYEPHLLHRLATSTPPLWYASSMQYSGNDLALSPPFGTIYPPYSLMKNSMTDPDGKKSITFSDKKGRKICDQKTDLAQSNTNTTWYEYDDKDRVVRVFPPGSSLSTPELIFENLYDADDNLIYKKVPDAAPELFVYNQRNLLIGSQNAILAAQNKWLVTHYDDYGRPIKKGFHHLAAQLPATDNPFIHELISEYFYDGFDGNSTNGLPIYKGKLRKSRVKVLEDVAANNLWIECTKDYDAYGRVAQTTTINHKGETEIETFTYDFADNVLSSTHTVNGSTPITENKSFTYDHRGRKILEKIKLNNEPEKTISQLAYNHRNEVIENNLGLFAGTINHQCLQSVDYTYNAQGWLTGINNLFSGTLPSGTPCESDGTAARSVPPVDPNTNTDGMDVFAQQLDYANQPSYSNLPPSLNGNISTQKWWHRGNANQSLSYSYDFLNRIKQSQHGQFSSGDIGLKNYFNENFQYDDRGNITKLDRKGMVSMSNLPCMQPTTIDSLQYSYLPSTNKLDKVVDKVPCLDSIFLPSLIDRDVVYAANEIIIADKTEVNCNTFLRLTTGLGTTSRLEVRDTFIIPTHCVFSPAVRVDRGACPDIKFSEGFNQQSNGSYRYDAAGNMTYDPHKRLTFQYNYLNLPYKITGEENDEMQILYNADGSLLQRKYIANQVTKNKIDYIANKEYHLDTLKIIHHDNGRILSNNSIFNYEYNIKDHLGNIRVTFSDMDNNNIISNNEIRSRNDYYAFGLKMKTPLANNEEGINKNLYGYNGKELWGEMDLSINFYGARFFDGAIGRFSSVDPLASKMPEWSPYSYGFNNPLRFIDLDGREPEDWIKNKATGQVEWRSNVTSSKNTPEGFSYLGNRYQGLEITKYSATKYGVEISANYDDGNFNPIDVQWVQSVHTNLPKSGGSSPYNDPSEGGDFKPFYYTDDEISDVKNVIPDGGIGPVGVKDLTFYDSPKRRDAKDGTKWQGELSLVENKKNKGYQPLITITYGFEINKGKAEEYPLKVSDPTRFQTSTLNNFNNFKSIFLPWLD